MPAAKKSCGKKLCTVLLPPSIVTVDHKDWKRYGGVRNLDSERFIDYTPEELGLVGPQARAAKSALESETVGVQAVDAGEGDDERDERTHLPRKRARWNANLYKQFVPTTYARASVMQ